MHLPWVGPKLASALASMQWLVWLLLASSLVLGIVAVFSPDRFRAIARGGARWIDTNRYLQRLDEPVYIDHLVLRHSRTFGLAVVLSSLFLAYLFAARFPI